MADKDMPEATIAPDATTDDGIEWDTISTSLGQEWDFDRDGPLVGHFLGVTTVETTKVERGEADAYQFAPRTEPDAIVFVWGSAEIVDAFDAERGLIRVGDLVKITFLGRDQFTGADGKPRQIKRYRVQAAKRV